MMPTVSRFFGITIRMYYDEHGHQRAHFHATVGEHEAVFDAETGDLLVGEIPTNKNKLVEAWAEIHKREILANWRRMKSGDRPRKIDPLA
jgi:hypothetical protein